MKKQNDFIILLGATVIILIFLGFVLLGAGQPQARVAGVSTSQTP
jgi:hypothetical protein